MATVSQNPNDVNCARKPYILALSPNSCCWHCEHALPPETCVALTGAEPANREFYMLLCSKSCADAVVEEVSSVFPKLRVLTAFRLSVLLQTQGRPAAVIEGWRGLIRPWYLVTEPSDPESN